MNNVIDTLSMVSYIIPGAVIGIAAAVATILLVMTTVSLPHFMKFSKNKELSI